MKHGTNSKPYATLNRNGESATDKYCEAKNMETFSGNGFYKKML